MAEAIQPRGNGQGTRTGPDVPPPSPLNVVGQNRLLTLLPAAVRDRVLSAGERVPLKFKQGLMDPDRPIPHAYFPLDGVCSVLTPAPGGDMVETATVGNEGMVGLPLVLGTDRAPSASMCQVPGHAVRVGAAALKRLMNDDEPFRAVLLRYVQAFMDLAAQSAACNRMHNIEERLARWMLLTRDRIGADEFPMTHEFLAQMLGVRRAGVTVAAGMLSKAGLISYVRGTMRIVDPDGLRAASCDCYDITRRDFERLLA